MPSDQTTGHLANVLAAPLLQSLEMGSHEDVCGEWLVGQFNGATSGSEDARIHAAQHQIRGALLRWMPNDKAGNTLDYLRTLASHLLESRGSSTSLREPHQDNDPVKDVDRVLLWRFLSLRIPQDLLIAALHLESKTPPPSQRVELLSHHLREELKLGVSEGHMHLNAGVPFTEFWRDAMSNPDSLWSLKSGKSKFDGRLAVLGAWLRWWLLESLTHRSSTPGAPPVGVPSRVRSIGRLLACNGQTSSFQDADWASLRKQTRRRLARRRSQNSGSSAQVSGRDEDEEQLTSSALKQIRDDRDNGQRSGQFELLFWRYSWIRIAAHQHCTSMIDLPGLEWFVRTFDMMKEVYKRSRRAKSGNHVLERAIEHDATGINLAAFEFRNGPETKKRGWSKELDRLKDHLNDPSAGSREVGFVVHFIKSLDKRGRNRKTGEVRDRNRGERRWFLDNWRQAGLLKEFLQDHPELIAVMRGFDTASRELDVPNWIAFPVLRRAQEASVRAAEQLACGKNFIPACRYTLHMGEDFRGLHDGLRRIHECLEFLPLNRGDRIGHGIALSRINRERGRGLYWSPLREHLDDLCWELDLYQHRRCTPHHGRVEWLRGEIARHAGELLGWPADVDLLVQARRARFEEGRWEPELRRHRRVKYTNTRAFVDNDPYRLARIMLFDPVVGRVGCRKVQFKAIEPDFKAMQAAEEFLIKEFGRLELTVESNPSSNLLISGQQSFTESPIFELMALGEKSARRPLHVSVNTDNPNIMSTTLADEYAYLHAALITTGMASSEALDVIRKMRESGMRSKFTISAEQARHILNEYG